MVVVPLSVLLCGCYSCPIPILCNVFPMAFESFTHTHRTFEWLDDRKVSKKMTKVPAKQFIDTALSQIQKQLRDESIFPTKFG